MTDDTSAIFDIAKRLCVTSIFLEKLSDFSNIRKVHDQSQLLLILLGEKIWGSKFCIITQHYQ